MTRGARLGAAALGLAASAACAIGLAFDPARALHAWLFAFVFWIGPALGCLGFLMLHNLVGGEWGRRLRPYLGSGALTLWPLALAFLPLAIGLRRVYPWAASGRAADPLALHQAPYLNAPFFLARAAAYFLIWGFLAWRLAYRGPSDDDRGKAWSGPGLVVLAFTGQFASVDWAMSLEPHWSSTMYGFLFLAQCAPAALALLLLTSALGRRSGAPDLELSGFRDLGALLLAFLIIWIYASFFQYMLIWFGDLPRENSWYLHRNAGGWRWFARGFVLFYFAMPFALLLFRANRGSPRRLAWLGGWLLFAHLAYVFWFIMPSFRPDGFGMHWLDPAAWLAVGGWWVAAYLWALARAARTPMEAGHARG